MRDQVRLSGQIVATYLDPEKVREKGGPVKTLLDPLLWTPDGF